MSLIRSLMRFRNKKRTSFQSRNRVFFESLEPRLLLSAAPTAEITTPSAIGDWFVVSADTEGKCFYTPVQNGVFGDTNPYFADKGTGGKGAGVGDFDNDNDLDVLFGDSAKTWYFEKTGDGKSFNIAGFINDPNSHTTRNDFAEADFDNDGNLDAVMAASNGSSNTPSFTFYRGDGEGGFTIPSPPPNPFSGPTGVTWIRGMDAADFNNDGKMDFVAAASTEAGSNFYGAYIFLGNGDGTFQTPTTRVISLPSYGVSAGDFNNDGKADLIFGSSAGLYLGLGNGNFDINNPKRVWPGANARAMAEADLDMDGDLDFLCTNTSGKIWYLINNGNVNDPFPIGTQTSSVPNFDNPYALEGIAITQKPPKGTWEFNEGAPVLFSATSRDLDVGDTLTFRWNWGDGTSTEIIREPNLPNNQIRTVDTSHVYANNGQYHVVLTVTDGVYTSTPATMLINILNVAPTVEAGADAIINEGDTLTSSGSFTDPGADTWTATVDYGDGTIPQALTLNPDKTFALNHVYADNGTYAAPVNITDDDTDTGIDTAVVTVNNVMPVVEAGGDATINEGGAFGSSGSFTDPGADAWTATVNYGDGSGVQPLTLNPDKTFVLNHVYTDNGTYTVTVSVTDDDSDEGNDTAVVNVNNVAPTVNAGADATIDEGGAFTSSGSFTDPGADTWTATVDYGDETIPQALTLNPDKTFALNHVYADNGTYAVTVNVTDDDSETGSDTAVVLVANVKPTVNAGADQTVSEGGPVSFSGAFADPGADTYTYLWDFGDGATASGGLTPVHVYADNGNYTATLTVTDDDGGVGTDNLVVTVNNVAPAVNAGADATINAGSAFISTGSFADPGTDSWTATVNYGDGSGVQPLTLNADKTFNLSHVYANSGTYNVTVSVVDDDTGNGSDTAAVTVNSVATETPGAEIVNGVLKIVGTAGKDNIEVKAKGNEIEVKANFLEGKKHTKTFNVSEFNSIEIIAGDGNDHVTIDKKITKPVTIEGGAGNDHLKAGGGPTTLRGGVGNDKLIGGKADDLLDGGDGNDLMIGGSGKDILKGGDGNDRLFGGRGDDDLSGGNGNDLLVGGPGYDTLDGGEGYDWLIDRSVKYKYCHVPKNGGFHHTQVSPFGSWVKDFVASFAGSNNHHIQIVIPSANKPKGRC